MSDEELSKRLGQYQRMAKLWQILGLIGTIGGLIAYFVVNDRVLKAILVAVLFFGGLCCILFLRDRSLKKLKALMTEQLGDFFRTELTRAFGPELQTDYGFAAVAGDVNPQDLDAVRKSYVLSLRKMQRTLDLIRNDT